LCFAAIFTIAADQIIRTVNARRSKADVTPTFRTRLELEQSASGVLAWQGEESMKRSRITEEQM